MKYFLRSLVGLALSITSTSNFIVKSFFSKYGIKDRKVAFYKTVVIYYKQANSK